MSEATPKLRFPGFKDDWSTVALDTLIERVAHPVQVLPDETYREIGVRSHGKGIFHKDEVSGRSIGDKRVFHVVPDTLVLNIVFAWEQAIAIVGEAERGFVASHRFPMYRPRKGRADLEFLRQFLLTKRGKQVLELASPGGAGRNKTLGQSEFLRQKIAVPALPEQERIASAIETVDRKIVLLREECTALLSYKMGLSDRLFRRGVRFLRDDGRPGPLKPARLGDLISELRAGTSVNGADSPAAAGQRGVLKTSSISGGRFLPSENKLVDDPLEAARLKEPIRQGTVLISRMNTPNLVGSSAYVSSDHANLFLPDRLWAATAVPDVSARWLGYLLSSSDVMQAISDRATGTSGSMKNLSKAALLSIPVDLPLQEEQEKIAAALALIDKKIDLMISQVERASIFRNGLIQAAFP